MEEVDSDEFKSDESVVESESPVRAKHDVPPPKIARVDDFLNFVDSLYVDTSYQEVEGMSIVYHGQVDIVNP